MEPPNPDINIALAVIEEICDGSDRKYYSYNKELHAVLPSIGEEILIEKLNTLGWILKWRKIGIREYTTKKGKEIWNRLAFSYRTK